VAGTIQLQDAKDFDEIGRPGGLIYNSLRIFSSH
jgi:hypothetical protein